MSLHPSLHARRISPWWCCFLAVFAMAIGAGSPFSSGIEFSRRGLVALVGREHDEATPDRT
ncbi:MAG: hypothetical protein MUP97_06070 [Acidimicrobiia bacterium]|nr:hypothetical protein [Acidimicrobiia bacterium]